MIALFLGLLQISSQPPPVESLGAGSGPLISPGGDWVVFRRAVITEHLGWPHLPEYKFEVWARHLKSREEKLLHKNARLSEWLDGNTVIFEDGRTAALKGDPARFVALPKDAHAVNAAWTKGGDRAAFITFHPTTRPGKNRTITIVEAGGKRTPIELEHALLAERPGTLAWSPDGRRLAFHQVFLQPEKKPIRRVGVINAETGAVRFVGEGNSSGNPGLEFGEGKGPGAGMWDAKGERFVFVTGRGGGEAEVHVASADGDEVLQVTEDTDCKWSPVLDPAGLRVAYCAAAYKNGFRTLSEGRVRVLDLLTGSEVAVKALTPGFPQRVAWLPDGSGIVWDWDAGGDLNLYRTRLQPLDPLPPGTTIKSAEQCRAPADREFIPDLRKALNRLGKPAGFRHSEAESELLLAVAALDAREAAPEVMFFLSWHESYNQMLALNLVGRWRLMEATDHLLAMSVEKPVRKSNAGAAGALAWLSHPTAWPLLNRFVVSTDPDVRAAVVDSLDGLSDPKAVGILIPLVEDPRIGLAAERALARITGMTFDRKPMEWAAWWARQDRLLPVVPTPNPAMEKLERD
jgi:hypothetical protein